MPEQTTSGISSEGVDRRLSFRTVRVHNNHLSVGQVTNSRCGICSEGLESALEIVAQPEKRADKDEVDKGDGADKDRDSASSYDYWANTARKEA